VSQWQPKTRRLLTVFWQRYLLLYLSILDAFLGTGLLHTSFATLRTSEVKSHVTQKLDQISVIRPERMDSGRINSPQSHSLRITSHLPAPIVCANEMDFKNGRIFHSEGLMTILDQVKWHTIVLHSLTSTHRPNLIRIGQPTKNLLWTYERTYGRWNGFIRWTQSRSWTEELS